MALRYFFPYHSIVKKFILNNPNWMDEHGISGTPRETITRTDSPAEVGIESPANKQWMAGNKGS
jgi:hypothetical protein